MEIRSGIDFSTANLFPSSKAAAIVTALSKPIPFIVVILSVDMADSPVRFPAEAKSSCAISKTFFCSEPVRNRIANSSALLNAPAPLLSSLSRGLSLAFNSLSFMITCFVACNSMKKKVNKSVKVSFPPLIFYDYRMQINGV